MSDKLDNGLCLIKVKVAALHCLSKKHQQNYEYGI